VSKYKGQDKAVGDLCQRLFKSRKAHAWPPLVEVQSNWPALYDAAREGLEVLPDVNMAVEWVNLYIQGLTPVNKQTDEA
jgi:hypothetical protein